MNIPKYKTNEEPSPDSRPPMRVIEHPSEKDYTFFNETHFRHMLRVERMRTERSKKPFLLLLIDISSLMAKNQRQSVVSDIKTALLPSLREIDIRGWYHHHSTIGIIFTDISSEEGAFIDLIMHKIYDRFCEKLDQSWMKKIKISFHLFPETSSQSFNDEKFNVNLYPDMNGKNIGRIFSLAVKRAIDLIGSAFALLLFAPVFLAISAAIKATSPGPVFFRQERVGLNGKKFFMLKFRSMKTDCDSEEHQKYIAKYICEQQNSAVEPGVFKLTNDSRITPVGAFLRQTSLDELPQLINVLTGEMSLVGPRPPIPYECDLYDIWHRRRLVSCKPGITGLWQVTGRSRTTFDEMVRLDLKYIRDWSLFLDIKILFMTPKAVLSGSGAM